MLATIKRWLSAGKLERAKVARFRAWCAHAEAVKRGDTREMHRTRKALFAATTEKLALEVQGSSRDLSPPAGVKPTRAELEANVQQILRRGLSA